MTSIIKVTSVQDTSGNNETTTANIKKAYDGAAKAWINFNGSGTIAIRTSENCASIVDNATGRYSVNFTSAMSTVDFCCLDSSGKTYQSSTTSTYSTTVSTPSTASQAHVCNGNEYEGTAQTQDCAYVGLSANGDLA